MSASYAAPACVTGLDAPFLVTLFADYAASTKTTEPFTLRSLAYRVQTVTASRKDRLPWLKCATFGDRRTDKNSLRHDSNVIEITGIEADYDGGQLEVSHAVEKMDKAGILAMIYTSPSHTADAPRFRVICPTSTALPPGRREKMLGRLNGLFGGIFASESWTLSQAYYYGSVNHNPSHEVHLIDGSPIDDHDDLDEIWLGKPATTTRTTATGERVTGSVDEPALLTDITKGTSYHASAVRLLGRWARASVPFMDARKRLLEAFDAVSPPDRDARWKARRADVDRCLDGIYGAEGAKKDRGLRPEEPPPPNGEDDYDGSAPGDDIPPDEPYQNGHDKGGEHVRRMEEPHTPTGLPLVWFNDLKPNLDAADFVEGILIAGAMSVIYGESNCGKTFFATDLALHVAMGRSWWGREVDAGGVIYCALEGRHGIGNRVAAFRKHHGIDEPNLPFAVVAISINLLDPDADTEPLITAIKGAAVKIGMPVSLVVIDTLSRALAGGNENAPDDMGALVINTDRVRQVTGAHVAFVHHSGKDMAKGARGHSLLRAATDTEIEVSRANKDSPSFAKVTKQREMEIEGEFTFGLQVVELGQNRRGRPVTSCVVAAQSNSIPAKDHPNLRLGKNAKIAADTLRRALSKYGKELSGSTDYPANTTAVTAEQWRVTFFEGIPGEKPDTKRSAFRRSRDELLAARIIASMDDYVWFVRAADE